MSVSKDMQPVKLFSWFLIILSCSIIAVLITWDGWRKQLQPPELPTVIVRQAGPSEQELNPLFAHRYNTLKTVVQSDPDRARMMLISPEIKQVIGTPVLRQYKALFEVEGEWRGKLVGVYLPADPVAGTLPQPAQLVVEGASEPLLAYFSSTPASAPDEQVEVLVKGWKLDNLLLVNSLEVVGGNTPAEAPAEGASLSVEATVPAEASVAAPEATPAMPNSSPSANAPATAAAPAPVAK